MNSLDGNSRQLRPVAEISMRAAGFAVLLGFVATVMLGLGAAPLACCGPGCMPCPPAFCKETPVFAASKVVAIPAAEADVTRLAVPTLLLAQPAPGSAPPLVSPGFFRPMRN